MVQDELVGIIRAKKESDGKKSHSYEFCVIDLKAAKVSSMESSSPDLMDDTPGISASRVSECPSVEIV
jgi:hypothetical protein